ncbi:MAG: tRNA(Met) cytidine acetyltransferase, partial [Myxococcales bacterium]|nr:tRNA(Met) cytidine acetyltransferase [Myxococcales bacterium]
APGGLRRVLGSDRDVVVLDLTGGVDADRVGMAHGLVRAGGVLVLRVDPEARGSRGLGLHPYDPNDVTDRLRDRLLERLPPGPPRLPVPCAPPTGTPEQAAVVDVLRARLSATEPTATVVLAPRGRGKSAALGLALAGLDARVALTSTDPDGLASVHRFCDAAPVDLEDVPPDAEVIVVDEAARVPLPALQRLVADHPCARLAFATTTDGYEGTGRGFVLRFLRWLEGERPTEVLRMSTPVRWAPDDPLERAVHDLFLLDLPLGPLPPGPLAHARLDRAALAADEPLLREVFALLVHAHYRTTPSDLHRILDAPNLDVHALFVGDRVGAVNLVAREGTLPAALSADLAAGRQRIRGHALADTLVCHAGRPDAGGLRMVRSVRLATHPDVRRRGLASRLVSAVHEAYDVDLFGTLFSADPDVVRFRRQHGYEVVRVGSSASARSGQPAVVMVRPVTPVARALLADLRAELALDWPTQR